ncbi:MAG: tRNA adenosine(34) deaminase TadA [Planctomycetes bacterium]|nr:tRNA adenosine(34) deaminase TadA [Planctomycetota bacterium]
MRSQASGDARDRGLPPLHGEPVSRVPIVQVRTLCQSETDGYDRRRPSISFSAGAPISDSELCIPDILSVHDAWMRLALEEARRAFDEAEVPVGAIIVHEQRVIAAAHNQRETLNDPTAHAEMLAITQAAEALGAWRLLDCTLYVTLEPCPMCAGAIVQARVPTVVYGTTDPKAGACHTLYQITEDPRLNHRSSVLGGVLADECRAILQEFFAERRAMGKK